MSDGHVVRGIKWEWAPGQSSGDNRIDYPGAWDALTLSFPMPPLEAEFAISSAYLAQMGVAAVGGFIRIRDAVNPLANGTWRITSMGPEDDLFTRVTAVKVEGEGHEG